MYLFLTLTVLVKLFGQLGKKRETQYIRLYIASPTNNNNRANFGRAFVSSAEGGDLGRASDSSTCEAGLARGSVTRFRCSRTEREGGRPEDEGGGVGEAAEEEGGAERDRAEEEEKMAADTLSRDKAESARAQAMLDDRPCWMQAS